MISQQQLPFTWQPLLLMFSYGFWHSIQWHISQLGHLSFTMGGDLYSPHVHTLCESLWRSNTPLLSCF